MIRLSAIVRQDDVVVVNSARKPVYRCALLREAIERYVSAPVVLSIETEHQPVREWVGKGRRFGKCVVRNA